MQMAAIEFGRNALGLKKANSTEADPKTPHPVIHIMEGQEEYLVKRQYGGTIRLGAWPCVIKKGTKLENAYLDYGMDKSSPWWQPKDPDQQKESSKSRGKGFLVFERHRHRYEFNPNYIQEYEKHGFVISGVSPDGKLVEAIELADHPFFLATQFHPEYISRPLTPHPVFVAFMKSVS